MPTDMDMCMPAVQAHVAVHACMHAHSFCTNIAGNRYLAGRYYIAGSRFSRRGVGGGGSWYAGDEKVRGKTEYIPIGRGRRG